MTSDHDVLKLRSAHTYIHKVFHQTSEAPKRPLTRNMILTMWSNFHFGKSIVPWTLEHGRLAHTVCSARHRARRPAIKQWNKAYRLYDVVYVITNKIWIVIMGNDVTLC